MSNEDNRRDDEYSNIKFENMADAVTKIKLPSFYQGSPSTWFILVESSFSLHRITKDETKYHYILTSLPEDIVLSIIDIINDPPEEDKYISIKQAILTRHTDSESKRLTKLLDGIAMGDDSPSQYFRRLELTAGASQMLSKDLLRQMWLNGLPQSLRAILASITKTDIATLQSTADKIYEMGQPSSVSTLTYSDPFKAFKEDILSVIDKKIESINNNRSFNRSRSKFRKNFQPAKRSFSPHPNNQKPYRSKSQVERFPNCYYHYKYGNKAHRCVKPCNFTDNSKN